MIWQVLLASLLVSVGGTLAAALVLFISEPLRVGITRILISVAIGILLGAALGGLLPEAVARGGNLEDVLHSVLFTLVALIAIEKVILWGHSNHDEGHRHHAEATIGPLVLIADGVHNLVDGVVIAAAFAASPALGLSTTLAVAAHELPHELSDFAVLLEAGYSRKRALLLNVGASLSTLVGALFASLALDKAEGLLPLALGVAAGSFIYIAIAALVPILHRHNDLKSSVIQLTGIALGVSVAFYLHQTLG